MNSPSNHSHLKTHAEASAHTHAHTLSQALAPALVICFLPTLTLPCRLPDWFLPRLHPCLSTWEYIDSACQRDLRRGRIFRQCVCACVCVCVWRETFYPINPGSRDEGRGRREETGEKETKFHSSSQQRWECIKSKTHSESSLSQRFHRGTSFIRTVRRSIRQTYTPCTVDKIISSLWIWLGSSVTWAIATLIRDDKSRKKGNPKMGRERKHGKAREERASASSSFTKQCSER